MRKKGKEEEECCTHISHHHHQFIPPPSILATFPHSFVCTAYGFHSINNVFQNTIFFFFSFVFRVPFLVTSFLFAWLLNSPPPGIQMSRELGQNCPFPVTLRLSKTRDNQRINYSILAPPYNTTSIFSRVNSESKREKGGPKKKALQNWRETICCLLVARGDIYYSFSPPPPAIQR